MVFTVTLKWMSFKQDISNIMLMLQDQQATYAVLRYAHDIPQVVFLEAMDLLVENKEAIYFAKLLKYVEQYEKNASLTMTADEEFVETVYLDPESMMLINGEDLEEYEIINEQD